MNMSYAARPAPDSRITEVDPRIARDICMSLFDLDGTIVKGDGQVSMLTGRAFEHLHRRGSGTGLATSRPWFACSAIVKSLGIKSPSICFSGAMVIDPLRRSVIHECPIDSAILRSFGDAAKKSGLLAEYFAAQKHYFEPEASPAGHERLIAIHSDEYLLGQRPEAIKSLQELSHVSILKVVVTAENEQRRKALNALAEAFPQLSHAFVTGGTAQPDLLYLNTTAAGAGRLEALRALAKYLQLDPAKNFMAFGDSSGDLPILNNVAVGVALENAPASVKSAVKYHTLSVDDDGVYRFVMRSF